MELSFTTKAESKRKAEQAFLALDEGERFYLFLKLMIADNMHNPIYKQKLEKTNNFVITKKKSNDGD